MIPELVPFYHAAENPCAVARDARQTHAGVMGTLCTYAPEELILAAGFHPMRLFPLGPDTTHAQNHIQSYCCSQVRGVLEDGLSGRLDFLSGMVFPHTCDAMQRLSDIWRMNLRPAFFADVIMPAKLNSQASRDYMVRVLEQFKTDLSSHTGTPISQEALQNACRLFNRIRGLIGRIYELQSQTPGLLTPRELATVTRAATLMERPALADHLAALVRALENTPAPKNFPKRLVLSGSVCDMPGVLELIDTSGACVVADDLCSGQRGFLGQIPEEVPPLEGIAARYISRMICPAKHMDNMARSRALIALAKESLAHGVIFTHLKFCDPHAFDLPDLIKALDAEGIRHLHIETDGTPDSSGQMSTRIETFIQTL